MKPGAVIVNTARGPIIDGYALYEALRDGRLSGAALDDLPEEPAKRRGWQPATPLLQLPNCLVTPHVAYYSEESLHYCRTFAAEEVVRVLHGESPRSPVNLAELRAVSSAHVARSANRSGGSL
jgi:D-3-phosphoglycerate dehydrogenase